MTGRFDGRTAVVTGASSGIGIGIARRFAAEGANVVVAARRLDRLDAVVAGFDPARALAVRTDVTEPEDLRVLMQRSADRFGGIDVLVSNAGMGAITDLEHTGPDEWRRLLAVNLDSCFFGAQAALPYLKASRGSIVQVASASGLGGDRRMVAYNAAKGAVVNLTRSLAFEVGRDGIRVNTVAPSLTFDPSEDPAFAQSDLVARFDERRAMPGFSTPDDIGAAVAFLASEDARRITGVVLPVDGGITAASGQPDLF